MAPPGGAPGEVAAPPPSAAPPPEAPDEAATPPRRRSRWSFLSASSGRHARRAADADGPAPAPEAPPPDTAGRGPVVGSVTYTLAEGTTVPQAVEEPTLPPPRMRDLDDTSPVLALPTTRRGASPRWWVVIVLALLTGGAAAGITSPLIGLAAGVVTFFGLWVPLARLVSVAVAVGCLAAGAVSVVHGQAFHPVAESSNWPSAFESAATLVWIAVVFLGADAVIETGRRVAGDRRARKTRRPTPDDVDPWVAVSD
jgi:hypothetical protein